MANRTQRNRTRANRAGGWAEWCWATALVAGLVAAFGAGVGFTDAESWSAGEQPPAPAAAPAPDRPAGWAATFTVGKTTVRSLASSAAFMLKPGEVAHAELPAGAFEATYSTEVTIDEKAPYRFGCEAEGGRAQITIFAGGQEVAKASGTGPATAMRLGGAATNWVELPAGTVTVSVRFTADASSTTGHRLRTVWERQWLRQKSPNQAQGFRAEPIPLGVTRAPAAFRAVGDSERDAIQGRVLLGELGCVKCHAAGEAASAVTERHAPVLSEIGRRASADWLAKWVLKPQEIKPGSGMPSVLGTDPAMEPEDNVAGVAIVHYLLSLNAADQAEFEAVATEEQVLAEGRRLYHSVGCVTCHGAFESPRKVYGDPLMSAEVPAEAPAVPYGNLAGKWRASGLAEFLHDPSRTRPGGRMPNMLLTKEEADLIATYLTSAWNARQGIKPAARGATFVVDPALAKIGKAAYEARGCASCHESGPGTSGAGKPSAKPLADLAPSKGCMDAKDVKTPRYVLSGEQRRQLAAGLESVKRVRAAGGAAGGAAVAPLDRHERTLAAMNCLACHAKDGRGGVSKPIGEYLRTLGNAELGDEGRIPPELTHVGWKLTTPWLKQVLLEAGRARPYMSARMPQFGDAAVGALAHDLAAFDGVRPDSDFPEPRQTDELAAAGRRLTGEKGLNCISCHVFDDAPAAGTPGPDLTRFAERLRYDWWKSYALSPVRMKPGTRMTAFWQTGRSAAVDVFAGDADRQTDALWAYFNLGGFAPPPEGLPKAGEILTVQVKDRPVVFRTFLKSAGARGVAVGFPAGVHFGFDAGGVRLVECWRGEFIDATGAWKGRGGEFTDEGRGGPILWSAPDGPPIVLGAEAPKDWPKAVGGEAGYAFRGYEFDAGGTPTFLYTLAANTGRGSGGGGGGGGGGATTVRERIEPAPEAGAGGPLFVRRFEVSGLKAPVLWVNAGKGSISLAGVEGGKAELVSKSGGTWVKVSADGERVKFTVEVEP